MRMDCEIFCSQPHFLRVQSLLVMELVGFLATQLTAAFLLTNAASGCTSGVRLHGGMREVSFA